MGQVLVLLAGVLGKLPGMERIDERGRTAAWVVGPTLIVLGLLLVAGVGDGDGREPPVTPADPADGPSSPDVATDSGPPTLVTVREIEPNDAAQGATLLPPASVGEGAIARPAGGAETADTDQFRFWATAGESVTVEVSRNGRFGTLYAVVYDPTGDSEPTRSLVNDVAPVGGSGPVTIEFTPRQTGYHYAVVTGSFTFNDIDFVRFDGGYGEYTVRVGTADARSVVAAVDAADRSVRGHD